jgi:hypothetical protein
MVVFAIEFHQFRFKVVADTGKDASQIVKHLFGEDFAPVFRDKDQVYVHIEYTMPSMSNIIASLHRPSIQ